MPPPPCPATSPSLQLPDKSKSRQVGKLASWQTLPPSPAPPTRAGCPSFLSYPAGKSPPPSRIAAKPPPPCIPAALAASFSLTPPVNQCPPAPSPLLPPRERSPSYPGVNQPHLCYTTHQRETPALRSPPPDPPARSPPLPSLLAPAGNGDSTMQSQHSAITAQRNHPPPVPSSSNRGTAPPPSAAKTSQPHSFLLPGGKPKTRCPPAHLCYRRSPTPVTFTPHHTPSPYPGVDRHPYHPATGERPPP